MGAILGMIGLGSAATGATGAASAAVPAATEMGPSIASNAFAAQQAAQGFNWNKFGDFMVGAGKGALGGIGAGIESYIRSETQPRPGIMVPGGGWGGGPVSPLRTPADEGILSLITGGRRGGGIHL